MAGRPEYSGIDLLNRGGIENSPDATTDQGLVNLRQLENRVDGLKPKNPVVVASQANITIATALNNGDTLDGVALVTGDRVLVKAQTASAENGIYIVGVTPARSADASTATELNGAMVDVIGGTDANTTQRQTAVIVTLGTDPVTFSVWGVVSTPDASETVKGKIEIATQVETDTGTDDVRALTPLKLKANLDANQVSGTVGDGSTQNPVITHSLGTKNLHVTFWQTASPFTVTYPEYEKTSTSAITLKIVGTALTSGELSYFISRR